MEPLCLIVDDEPALRTYLSIILQHKGIQCIGAENAAEALRILHKRHGEIDLLITDIHMPGNKDGVDLAYAVKHQFSSMPVILISGAAERVPTGFTFVRKPFMPDAILNAIDKTMMKIRVGSPR